MGLDNIIFDLVLIFAGAALFATLFLYLKQPIILAYIALGIAMGPWGAGLIYDAENIEQLSRIGIILLLFLIGMNLKPDKLYLLFGRTAAVTLTTCLMFLLLGAVTSFLFGFSVKDSLIIGAALMFSSTIVSLKLIPTTALHHKHMGDMMISVLLLQDVIAIILILIISGNPEESVSVTVAFLLMKLVLLAVVSFYIVKKVITEVFKKFDRIREFSFILFLGWGLLVAGAAHQIGLSYEIGAFIAGVSLATFPVTLVIAEDLKPLRDFFLILFFFSIGARFDFLITQHVLMAGLVLALVLVLAKPVIFKWCFKLSGEKDSVAGELGIRLGQASEFSLLVAYSALLSGQVDPRASYLIQIVVVITFVISTYWVVSKYRTPISSVASLRQD
jgi:Kef-type K+ transport system membrane component KefB